MSLTDPQTRALHALALLSDEPVGEARRPLGYAHPHMVARVLWPDSPGWERRSRRGSTPAGGALGATMPMKAATLLWRLQRAGLAAVDAEGRWRLTARGREAADALPDRDRADDD